MNILLLGKSAAGKDTMAYYLSSNLKYRTAVSVTTRPKRDYETDGIDYYYVSNEKFDEMKSNGEFIETSEYRGWKYGTLETEDVGDNTIFVVNPKGLEAFKKSGKNFVSIYIDVHPGVRILRQVKRGDELKEIERRLYTDDYDFCGIENEVDYTVRNDMEVKDCINEILKCVLEYKNK